MSGDLFRMADAGKVDALPICLPDRLGDRMRGILLRIGRHLEKRYFRIV